METNTTNTTTPKANKTNIDTNGWDTAYAIYYPTVNKAIVDQGTSPKKFNVTKQGYSYKGTFGPWQLIPGGAGDLVHMTIPITESTYSAPLSKKTVLSPIKFTIELNLAWFDMEVKNNYHLKVSEKMETIAIVDKDWGKNTNLDLSPEGMIPLIFRKYWLIENISLFTHVFAALDLDSDLATSNSFKWIKPTDKGYAVSQPSPSATHKQVDINQCIFAVLCMTQNRPNPGYLQITPNCIPPGVNSSFVINKHRILDQFFRPNLGLLFQHGVTPDDFSVNELNCSLSNNKTLTFLPQEFDLISEEAADKLPEALKVLVKPFVSLAKMHVTPKIDAGNFSIRLSDTFIEIELTNMYFGFIPGMTIHLSHTSRSILTINKNKQLNLTVNPNKGDYSTTACVTTSTTFSVIEIVAGIALSMAGAVAGGFIGGALGEAGAVSAGEAGSAAASIGADAAASAATDAVSNLSTETMTNAAIETGSAASGKALGAAGKLTGIFNRIWPKLLGSIIGAGAGQAISEIPKVITTIADKAANDPKSIPNLDDLGTEALAPIQWNSIEDKGFIIKDGFLNGDLVIGINYED